MRGCTRKEIAKVTHDINNVWHVKYSKSIGKICSIVTHSNKANSPAYVYIFVNYGFDNYVLERKESL